MSNRCPKCRTPNLLHTSDGSEAGWLETCPRCATTWFARSDKDGLGVRPVAIDALSGRRRRPVVIEAATAVDSRFTMRVPRQAVLRLTRWIAERCQIGRVFPVAGDR